MAGPSVPGATDALKRFELENSISEIDTIYSYDNAEQQQHLQGNPWRADPKYFKRVRISATALIKMVMHARSGGISGNFNIEVMGLMQGKIDTRDPAGPTFIVMDAFALPVEATETRVNAQADAYEYMVEYQSMARDAGRLENVVGWYHSHPGYGCWLSGIDVATQSLNQQFQEPWLAVVIDPTRTVSAGKVEIGAFRTYPEGYKPPDAVEDGFQSIPLEKAEDFGAHANQYYPVRAPSSSAPSNPLPRKPLRRPLPPTVVMPGCVAREAARHLLLQVIARHVDPEHIVEQILDRHALRLARAPPGLKSARAPAANALHHPTRLP